MPTYLYRCAQHGPLEQGHPIGTASETTSCPACGVPAPRVFTAPHLAFGSATRRALIEGTERTRDVPDVVTRSAPHPAGRRFQHPALSRLPRP